MSAGSPFFGSKWGRIAARWHFLVLISGLVWEFLAKVGGLGILLGILS